MLSEIDNQLFPNRCEVIQIGASQRFVFPIMKNGSSSFYMPVQFNLPHDFKIVDTRELTETQQQEPFITFLRNPKSRFISGVNTYLQHLERDGIKLDTKTVLWFVDNYLFLNRHYCPQFFWLLNLATRLGPTVRFEFKSMSDLSAYTNYHHDAKVLPPTEEFLELIKQFNWKKLELYFYLDQVIIELIGQTVSFREIVSKIKQIPVLNDCILTNTLEIANALSST